MRSANVLRRMIIVRKPKATVEDLETQIQIVKMATKEVEEGVKGLKAKMPVTDERREMVIHKARDIMNKVLSIKVAGEAKRNRKDERRKRKDKKESDLQSVDKTQKVPNFSGGGRRLSPGIFSMVGIVPRAHR